MKSIREAIYVLINEEPRVSSKLDMLTAIYLSTTCKKVRKATEEIRDKLCAGTEQKQKNGKGSQLDFTYQRKGSRKILLQEASNDNNAGDSEGQ